MRRTSFIRNRVKFFFSASFLEFSNRRIADDPYGRLVLEVSERKPRCMVDLCGGTGYLSRKLVSERAASHVLSIDLSPELLRHGARASAGSSISHVLGDAGRLPIRSGSLELVVSTFALHELPSSLRGLALEEVVRILAPGGELIVIDLDEPSRYPRALFHAYLYLSHGSSARTVLGAQLTELVTRAGLSVRSQEGSLGRMLPFQVLVAEKPAATSA